MASESWISFDDDGHEVRAGPAPRDAQPSLRGASQPSSRRPPPLSARASKSTLSGTERAPERRWCPRHCEAHALHLPFACSRALRRSPGPRRSRNPGNAKLRDGSRPRTGTATAGSRGRRRWHSSRAPTFPKTSSGEPPGSHWHPPHGHSETSPLRPPLATPAARYGA